MTVLELAELIKKLETEFGVTAAAPVVATATTAAATPFAAGRGHSHRARRGLGPRRRCGVSRRSDGGLRP